MEEDKPIAKFQAGAVTCALWQNRVNIDGRTTTILKATVGRRYQDRDGIWQTSQSFSRNEVPMAIHVLQKAFEAMLEKTPEQEIRDATEDAAGRPHGSRAENGKVRA